MKTLRSIALLLMCGARRNEHRASLGAKNSEPAKAIARDAVILTPVNTPLAWGLSPPTGGRLLICWVMFGSG